MRGCHRAVALLPGGCLSAFSRLHKACRSPNVFGRSVVSVSPSSLSQFESEVLCDWGCCESATDVRYVCERAVSVLDCKSVKKSLFMQIANFRDADFCAY